MRHYEFEHPEEIEVKLPEGNGYRFEKRQFADWMEAVIGSDPRFDNIKTGRIANRVIDAIRKTQPKEMIRIAETDYEFVKPIVEKPAMWPANIWIGRQVIDWHDKFLAATLKVTAMSEDKEKA